MMRLKKVVRYVQHSKDLVLELTLDFEQPREIRVASDADWIGEEGKSTSGYIITFMGMLIASGSKSQSVVARSAPEAELYGLNTAVSKGLFVQSILKDILNEEIPIRVWTDSSSALGIISRRGLGKIDHVGIEYLWLQQAIREREIYMEKETSAENPADMLTKGLGAATLEKHVAAIGLKEEGDAQ